MRRRSAGLCLLRCVAQALTAGCVLIMRRLPAANMPFRFVDIQDGANFLCNSRMQAFQSGSDILMYRAFACMQRARCVTYRCAMLQDIICFRHNTFFQFVKTDLPPNFNEKLPYTVVQCMGVGLSL